MLFASTVVVAVFVALSLYVGLQLIHLSTRAHAVPALSIGLTALLSGGIGFPMLFVTLAMPEAVGGAIPWFRGIGLAAVNLGAVAFFVFTWRTFRPTAPWATLLVVSAAAALVGSLLLHVSTSGLAVAFHEGEGFWLAFGIRILAAAWAAVESLRYYGLMRKRLRLGLTDPLLANRFLLWGLGSLGVALMSCASALTILLSPTANPTLVASLRVGGAALGMASLLTTWLAFFPPNAYRRRFPTPATSSALETAQ